MIEVKNLVKRYGAVEAVRGVSFTVGDGLICGFLGPNGAGKSTTMNIITGCLAATEGEVYINGYDIYEDPIAAKSCIGYLPEQPPLYQDMTPSEYLEFVGRAKGLKGDALYKAVETSLAKTGLGNHADRIIKNLSKGYKQRVGIAQAIMGDPDMIILDEPTVGLDPRQVIEIRDLIRELGRDHTVILSSHILTEISAVCDYVIIISGGRIVASDTLENLTVLYEGKNHIDLLARGDEAKIRRAVESIKGVIEVDTEPVELGRVHARIATDNTCDIREELFFRFADMKAPILSMEYEEVTLEKVFLELTGESKRKITTDIEPMDKKSADAVEPEKVEESSESESRTEDNASSETAKKRFTEGRKADRKKSEEEYKPLFGGSEEDK